MLSVCPAPAPTDGTRPLHAAPAPAPPDAYPNPGPSAVHPVRRHAPRQASTSLSIPATQKKTWTISPDTIDLSRFLPLVALVLLRIGILAPFALQLTSRRRRRRDIGTRISLPLILLGAFRATGYTPSLNHPLYQLSCAKSTNHRPAATKSGHSRPCPRCSSSPARDAARGPEHPALAHHQTQPCAAIIEHGQYSS
ncbi:hypothetical protein V8C44DRAFT_312578 [Trichoderma aethiopicum]